jgi:hypothetical protein
MKPERDVRLLLNLLSIFILVAGFGSGLAIYVTADNNSKTILGYEQGDGSAYPIMPQDSKSYQRGLEYYGGKSNIVADNLRRWFSGLWHGKALAVTVVCIGVLISLAVFFIANYLLPPP